MNKIGLYNQTNYNCAFKNRKVQNVSTQENNNQVSDEKSDKVSKQELYKKRLKLAFGIMLPPLMFFRYKQLQVKNVKSLQRAFQKAFLRDDITPEMAKQMKARYQEIEKIKDTKEYTKALFEEAKKNFGLEGSDIKLIFESDSPSTLGFCRRDNSAISITPRSLKNRKNILNTMHHEFRHALQHKLVYSAYPDQVVALNSNLAAEVALSQMSLLNKSKDEIVKDFMKSLGKPVSQRVLNKNRDFIRACYKNMKKYTNSKKDFCGYLLNFVEMDARDTGYKVEKYVREKTFNPNTHVLNNLPVFFKHKAIGLKKLIRAYFKQFETKYL